VSWRRRLGPGRLLLALLLGGAAVCVAQGWVGFGHRAEGERRERVERSPQWAGGHFNNPQPLDNHAWRSLAGALHMSPDVSPHTAVPVVRGGPPAAPPPTGLRVTWLGHSSTLVEIDGARLLTDPAWSGRASPLTWVGPTRWFPPPLPLEALPPIDAVLISHDHYDHLDQRTIAALDRFAPRFIVPLGVGAHLAYWGIPASRIVELDWWGQARVGEVEVTCTPARHASGRMLVDDDATLWAGYALRGPRHRVYYSGDTGLFPALREIGRRLGPFDLTMIEVGQYGAGWPDWHLGPEQAVRAHQLVGGKVLLPVHWGAFALAYHGWTEPIERTLVAAAARGVTVLAPRPGEAVEPQAPPPLSRWWPELPWKTAAEDPIAATKVGTDDR